jgi:pantoate--beta-alanine ligase
MQVVYDAIEYAALCAAARASGARVALVPTLGALHSGHASLITRAAAQCDFVAVSVFVNPTQFADPAAAAAYPRDLAKDTALAGTAGAHLLFAPSVTALYPCGLDSTSVHVPHLTTVLEGASRPGHFAGVATVVTKLLNLTGPCHAYFGEKDYQQLLVIRALVTDLALPTTIVACPTLRDSFHLAYSSRNAQLSPAARHAALSLYRALATGALLTRRNLPPSLVESHMANVARADSMVDLDYAVLVEAATLSPTPQLPHPTPLRLLIATTIAGVRLIDNLDPAA